MTRRPTRRTPRKLEFQMQCALITWLGYEHKKYPELAFLYAIPNGGKRHKAIAAQMKAMGAKAGVWDLCLPAARVFQGRVCHSLYVEMKTTDGDLTPAQRDFGAYLQRAGFATSVCRTAEEARNKILSYLNLPKPEDRCYAYLPDTVKAQTEAPAPAEAQDHPPPAAAGERR